MYYKDFQNKLHSIESNQYACLLPPGSVEITHAEAEAIRLADVPTKTVLELDIEKYQRRANSKPLLMAEMAAMNVGRLKDGTWTTAQLVSLMADAQIKNIVSCMETLSFELAIQAIQTCTNPLITADIKQAWITRLVAKL